MSNYNSKKLEAWTDDEKQAFVDDYADFHFAKPYFPDRMMEYLRDYREGWHKAVESGDAYLQEPKAGETFNEYLYRLLLAPDVELYNLREELETAEALREFLDKAIRSNINIGKLKEHLEQRVDESISWFNGSIFPLVFVYADGEKPERKVAYA